LSEPGKKKNGPGERKKRMELKLGDKVEGGKKTRSIEERARRRR